MSPHTLSYFTHYLNYSNTLLNVNILNLNYINKTTTSVLNTYFIISFSFYFLFLNLYQCQVAQHVSKLDE